jgi:hypothetical protein
VDTDAKGALCLYGEVLLINMLVNDHVDNGYTIFLSHASFDSYFRIHKCQFLGRSRNKGKVDPVLKLLC